MGPELWNVLVMTSNLLLIIFDIFNYADDNTLAEIDDDIKDMMRQTFECGNPDMYFRLI